MRAGAGSDTSNGTAARMTRECVARWLPRGPGGAPSRVRQRGRGGRGPAAPCESHPGGTAAPWWPYTGGACRARPSRRPSGTAEQGQAGHSAHRARTTSRQAPAESHRQLCRWAPGRQRQAERAAQRPRATLQHGQACTTRRGERGGGPWPDRGSSCGRGDQWRRPRIRISPCGPHGCSYTAGGA
eukprot:6490456-Amphidinium_carterae.2